MTTQTTAEQIAERTADAFMASTYGPTAWRQCARLLLGDGFSPAATEWMLRSKHMRWADDEMGSGSGHEANSGALRRYIGKHGLLKLQAEASRGAADEAAQ